MRSLPLTFAALPKRLTLVAGGIVALTVFAPRLHAAGGLTAFCLIALVLAAAGAWAAMANHDGDERQILIVILSAAAAMRLSLMFTEPYLSSDLYRYVWDGRVQVHGINPYRYIPSAPELSALRDSAIYPRINRATYAPTIYPPAAQIIFLITAAISDSVLGIKACMLAFEALGIACLCGILRQLGLPLQRIAAYVWHPLALWEIAGNAHIDAAMTGTMLFSLWLYLTRGPLQAAAVATIAALMKPLALILMPVYWRPWDWRMPLLMVAIIALFYAPYVSVGWQVLGFAAGYVAEEGYQGGGGFWYPEMLQRLTGAIPGLTRLYLAAAAIALSALALWVGFRSDRTERASIAAAASLIGVFLILLTPHYPWYYLAAAPFLAVYPRLLTLWVLTVGGLQIHNVIDGDVVIDHGVRQYIFHSTVLFAIFWDFRAAIFIRRAFHSGASS